MSDLHIPSIVNSITMSLLLEVQDKVYNPGGYADTYEIVRDTAQEIVENFVGSLLGNWKTDRPIPQGGTIAQRISSKIIRELHRQTKTAKRVDADEIVERYVTGIIAALISDWPHKTRDGRPLPAL